MEDPIDRRQFLRLGVASAISVGVTSACTSKNGTGATRTPAHSGISSQPAASRYRSTATSPQAGDLDTLERLLDGPLIRPDDARFAAAAQLFDPRFDGIKPLAIAKCAGPQDVQRCLEFVRATATPVAARSGGHSYGGYSTTSGLVVDVGAMNTITRGAAPGTARIGAGARLADVYAKLAANKESVPAGSCPTVGISGLALGGGIGVVSRKYGLTCDALTAVELVTADGHLVRCDERTEPELFWAHRGGGGGNFGVVTALEFRTFDTRPVTHFLLRWDWAHARDAVAAWQAWLPTTPDELWSSLHLDGAESASGSPHIYVTGVYVGDPNGAQPLLDELQQASKAPMTTRFVKEEDYLQTMMIEGGCANLSVAQCHLKSDGGILERGASFARSDFIAHALPSSAIDVVVTGIEARTTRQLFGGGVLFDAYGGAINRIAPTDTAFAHRDKLACLQYVARFPNNANKAFQNANKAWLDDIYAAMRPHVSGYAYQNYIDPDLADWKHAYYGVNLDRLIAVKKKYDPSDIFRFAQGVPAK